MEFGGVPENAFNNINFNLPNVPLFNQAILQGLPATTPKVYIGCAKWGRTEWVGKIYPEKTKKKDFLQHYNSIELNATHYKIDGTAGIAKWAEIAADKDFLYCPKMHQGVTHCGSLTNKYFATTEFLKDILAFGKHLGPTACYFKFTIRNPENPKFDFGFSGLLY
ncbi:MAG: DUF72 domain-containing protein [Flavobacterium sp.]|nr:DUF72 domain-containing protein [Flavobacterium sp.]